MTSTVNWLKSILTLDFLGLMSKSIKSLVILPAMVFFKNAILRLFQFIFDVNKMISAPSILGNHLDFWSGDLADHKRRVSE